MARSATSACSCAKRIDAASGSSPNWCWRTRPMSTRGSSGPGWPSPGRCTAISTSGATPLTASRGPASSSRTSSRRTGRSIPSPRPTSGTASTRTSPASTTTTRPCDKPCSTWWTTGCRWASTVSGWMRCRISTPARERHARTFRRPSPFSGSSGPTSTVASTIGCCWPRPISGPKMPWRTWAGAIPATWPSTSPSCPACSWRPARRTGSPWWTSWRRRPPPLLNASGPCSSAITTS